MSMSNVNTDAVEARVASTIISTAPLPSLVIPIPSNYIHMLQSRWTLEDPPTNVCWSRWRDEERDRLTPTPKRIPRLIVKDLTIGVCIPMVNPSHFPWTCPYPCSNPLLVLWLTLIACEPAHRLVNCLECDLTAPYTAQTTHTIHWLHSLSPSTYIALSIFALLLVLLRDHRLGLGELRCIEVWVLPIGPFNESTTREYDIRACYC